MENNDFIPKDGYYEQFYDDGSLDYRGAYLNGKQHGEWESYWGNGNLWYRGSFNNGQLIGHWEFRSYNGEIIIETFYT